MTNKLYICDTNIFISAVLSGTSPPAKVVEFIFSNEAFFVFSNETSAELVEVFQRKKFDRYSTQEDRTTFLEKILNASQSYTIHNPVEICRDPKDNKFLDVALASNAEFIITGDEDLLVLESIGQTAIITPKAFIDLVA